jgi:pimeloyl-ACP methyl ester carboxylesterase
MSRVRTSDGVELHVEAEGDPRAPVTVVFAHGWALSADAWSGAAARVARAARVIRYDQRGHGRSGPLPPTRTSIGRLAEDLLAVLDALVPLGPVVLVGHSMGGMTMLALARSHPDLFAGRVAGVVLVDTSAGGLRGGTLGLPLPLRGAYRALMALTMLLWRRWPALNSRLRARLGPNSHAVRWAVRRFIVGPDASQEAMAASAELIHAAPTRTVGAFYPALLAHDEAAGLPVLRDTPALVMVGDHDLLTPPAHSRRLAEALPEAELVQVLGSGHMLPVERPGVVAHHLLRLIERATGRRPPPEPRHQAVTPIR